ncbi:GTP cyclohydrolase [Gammaproteobacteria bacterium SCGC AG-212-F23]|nr:GTP cyclohydrolase [Gammaproteobacteria bacterium SCGC AG-212-F23]
MFIIQLDYTKPLEVVDQYLQEHRDYLETCYQKNHLVVSGPRNPRTGGIIISQLKDREKVDALIKADPFYINDIAEFSVIEFSPVKYHKNFVEFV